MVSVLEVSTQFIRKILSVTILICIYSTVMSREVLSSNSGSFNHKTSQGSFGNSLINGLPVPYNAPQIDEGAPWINSPPLRLDQLKGKVVMIDFWTYSCINCVRTLPYLTKWDRAYRDKGLVIIGVHSPEFPFEQKLENVQNAIKKHNIQYPIVLDNDLKTWSNFRNRYWPAHYLIDQSGKVVYVHFGEGAYDITEYNIRFLLGLETNSQIASAQTLPETQITPETYLGYERADGFVGAPLNFPDQVMAYPLVNDIPVNKWSLEGKWIMRNHYVTPVDSPAKIKLHFLAKKVFVVLGNANGRPVEVGIKLNGQSPGKSAGKDVKGDQVVVSKEGLYELINQDSNRDGLLEIHASSPELQAYVFTFEN